MYVVSQMFTSRKGSNKVLLLETMPITWECWKMSIKSKTEDLTPNKSKILTGVTCNKAPRKISNPEPPNQSQC